MNIRTELAALAQELSRAIWQKLLRYFGLYVLPAVLFVALANEVREQETLGFDTALLNYVHSVASPGLDTLVRSITDFGYIWWVSGLTIAGVVWLVYHAQRRNALILATGVAGSALLNLILKALFQRDRPQLWERIVTENSHSFPSGHAMASASLTIALMVILWPTRWRWWAIVGGSVYMVVIAWTRLYLGVHYPTDIIAGWLMTAAWVLMVAGLIRHWCLRRS